jgi:DNA methylase.
VHIVNADSISADFKSIMAEYNIDSFDLVMLHPPYWDIIKFSESPSDLSNAETLQDFLEMFTKVAKKAVDVVKAGGYISLVIGDAYRKGEIIPLGFMCMDVISKMGMKTKGIIVKDMQNNRGKRNSENLWRYRALKSGFYIFKHEYVFVFMKPTK